MQQYVMYVNNDVQLSFVPILIDFVTPAIMKSKTGSDVKS